MTHTDTQQEHLPLGVGAIFGESFGLLFRNFIPVVVLSSVVTMLTLLSYAGLVGTNVAIGLEDPTFSSGSSVAIFMLGLLIQIGGYGLASAFLIQLAYDAKLDRPIEIGRYISSGIKVLPAIIFLTIIVSVLMVLGFVALIVPGLWAYAVLSVFVPAIVIEKAGFGALGRSSYLTKGYRWPIMGALVLVGICVGIFNSLSGAIAGLIIGATTGADANVLSVCLVAIATSIGTGLNGMAVALIYARLREIKEGVSVDQIATVFD